MPRIGSFPSSLTTGKVALLGDPQAVRADAFSFRTCLHQLWFGPTSIEAPETAPTRSATFHCSATSDAIGMVEFRVRREPAPELSSDSIRSAHSGTNFLSVYAGLAFEHAKTRPPITRRELDLTVVVTWSKTLSMISSVPAIDKFMIIESMSAWMGDELSYDPISATTRGYIH